MATAADPPCWSAACGRSTARSSRTGCAPGRRPRCGCSPDDRLTVINRDGGQVAELTVLDAEGGEDGAAIGVARGRARRTCCAA